MISQVKKIPDSWGREWDYDITIANSVIYITKLILKYTQITKPIHNRLPICILLTKLSLCLDIFINKGLYHCHPTHIIRRIPVK